MGDLVHHHQHRTNDKSSSSTSMITTICSVNDYQVIAKRKLSKALYEYLASGTDDEQTLNENRNAFKGWYLRPRVLKPITNLTTTTTLFGRNYSMPVFVSPAGVHALVCHDDGECATAKACQSINIIFGHSQHATKSIEQVAMTCTSSSSSSSSSRWYQAYILKDRDLTMRLIHRAKMAGCHGIFLTVDSIKFGFREADARNGFNALPPPHRLVNYDEDNQKSMLESTYNSKSHQAWDQNSELMFDQNVSWDDVRWLKNSTICQDLPLVVKGIMTREDALLAIKAGVDGIMVSNHGGRQLDGCLAAIDALPEVVEAVQGRVPVLMDGGIRRGTDILKALALGASAVGIGKPVFFALAVGGQTAVEDMLHLLQKELQAAMALCGCQSIKDITPNLITRHPSGSPPAQYIRSAL